MYMQETQGNHGDFQHSNGYAVTPENDGASVTGVLADFSKSLSKTTTQPYVLEGSCAGLQTARIQNSRVFVNEALTENSLAKRDFLNIGLNDFVNINGTEKKKNNLLSSLDINYIKYIANNFIWQESDAPVDINVKKFLNQLPENIKEKLTVIVSTHESNGLPYYGRNADRYYSKVFVLGAVENEGAVIIDLPNMHFPSSEMLMSGSEFFSKALKPIIKRTLGFLENNRNQCHVSMGLKNHVPEFRFISSKNYTKNWSHKNMYNLESPYTEKNNSSSINNPLCKGSYRLNIFEFFSLVNNQKPWNSLIKEYDDTPYDRLGIDSKDSDIPDTLIEKLKDISR